MSDSERYTTISVHKGVREDLKHLKDDDETYTDILYRALGALSKQEERHANQFEFQNARIREQSRLLVRMADEMGLDAEQIPSQMAEAEAFGEGSTLAEMLSPPEEQTTDVNAPEKAARLQAHDEIVGEDGRVSEEQAEEIEQRKQEILEAQATDDEGWTDGFNNDGDDH